VLSSLIVITGATSGIGLAYAHEVSLITSMLHVTGIFRILAHHIRPHNFVTSLYGKFRAEKLLHKDVIEL